MRPKKRKLHELPYREMVKSGTIVGLPLILYIQYKHSIATEVFIASEAKKSQHMSG